MLFCHSSISSEHTPALLFREEGGFSLKISYRISPPPGHVKINRSLNSRFQKLLRCYKIRTIVVIRDVVTKKSIIEKTYLLKNLPSPSLPKRGIPPFCKACLPVGRGRGEGEGASMQIRL